VTTSKYTMSYAADSPKMCATGRAQKPAGRNRPQSYNDLLDVGTAVSAQCSRLSIN